MWNKKPWVDSKIRNFDYIADHLAPEVSSADAGKVMTVDDDGKWIAGTSGGSGGGEVQLYGPYEAETPEAVTVSAHTDEVLYLDDFFRFEGNERISIDWPDTEDVATLLVGFSVNRSDLTAPYSVVYQVYSGTMIRVVNGTDNSENLVGSTTFYSTVRFPDREI